MTIECSRCGGNHIRSECPTLGSRPAMTDAQSKLILMAERAFAQRDKLADAILEILKANDEFRAGMPDEWEGDPLQDACEAARKLVAAVFVGSPGQT